MKHGCDLLPGLIVGLLKRLLSWPLIYLEFLNRIVHQGFCSARLIYRSIQVVGTYYDYVLENDFDNPYLK